MKKMTINKIIISAYLLLILLLSTACQQYKKNKNVSWALDPELSKIAIITTKNNSISEVSEFKIFSGKIDKNNELKITINLNSLETNIPIRNERIQKHLFQSDIYPTADIHTQLKPEDLENGIHSISFDVDLHGVSEILSAEFMVFEQDGNKVITLHSPLIIQAKDFGLDYGIVTLRKLAKLNSISFSVPVALTLTFTEQ